MEKNKKLIRQTLKGIIDFRNSKKTEQKLFDVVKAAIVANGLVSLSKSIKINEEYIDEQGNSYTMTYKVRHGAGSEPESVEITVKDQLGFHSGELNF